MAVFRRPAAPWWLIPLAVAALVMLLPQLGVGYGVVRQVQLALILALVVSGLNLSLGYAGELALGQAAMYAGGAYTAGLLSRAGHTDLLLQLAAAGLVALAVGLLTGVPGLRLGGWSLAMTSFFLVLLVPDVIAIFAEATGGRNGLSGIQGPTLLGTPLASYDFYVVMVLVAVAWFAVLRNIVVSRHGTALRVLKQSPVLATSMGMSVYRMKLLAYALGAVPAGLAGALFANLDLYISPAAFSFTFAITVLAASILGGSASVYGALVGAFLLQVGLDQSGDHEEYSLLITGAFLMVGGVLLTGGLAGLGRALAARFVRTETPHDHGDDIPADVDVPPLLGQQLRIEGVSKCFGGNHALAGVDLTAEPGRVTALIGPNGSGKTTLLNMTCGFYTIDAGSVRLDGESLRGRAPHSVARAGVSRTFQTPNIPEGVTVLEAVSSGRYATNRATVLEAVLRLPRFRRVRREDAEEAHRALEMVGLDRRAGQEAGSLPLGQRRLLEVARCLVRRPGVLLLDEVASGLDEEEVDRLGAVIRRVRDAGGTVVLVEHNFGFVLEVADTIVALAHGQVMARGTPEEIERDPRVRQEYLGVDPTAEQVAAVGPDPGATGGGS